MDWFITCPKGIEELLGAELDALGAASHRLTIAGVYATGSVEFAYRVCLWSRLANRILLPLGRFEVSGPEDLYRGVKALDWLVHLTPEQTFAVDFSGTDQGIRHTRFGAQTVKDGLVDYMQETCGRRPNVDLQAPDIRLNARLAKGRCVVSLDMAGESLHRRGYRREMVAAPLKENLAAALLIRSGWPAVAARGGALIDPMCGSATLLLEGAMMAADIAPGLLQRRFGSAGWLGHDNTCWQRIQREAEERRAAGLAGGLPEIRGYDKDTRAIVAAQANIEAAGLTEWVRVSAKPIEALQKPTHRALADGLIITNPPYGERWGEVDELKPVYTALGERAKRAFPGWRLAVFTGNAELAGELKLRARKKYPLFNGTIASQLLLYDLHTDTDPVNQVKSTARRALSENAQMLVNRLEKNRRRLQPWLKREGITCYRLYDSDLPEYAVAVDIYEQAIHIQEYAPPPSVDSRTANLRLAEVKQAVQEVFPASADAVYLKERRRQKGANQYQRINRRQRSSCFTVREDDVHLEVNLSDYLDTGLFLDHRPMRRLIAEQAAGKRFLNLFCYTAAVTVHAVRGGAQSSLSIDLSNTYLAWAERNFALNGIDPRRHQLLRADCLAWLDQASRQAGRFDLIFLDPPTFSNSKMTASVLDVQRDHPILIERAMTLLAPGGTLFFSNNFRRFKMAAALFSRFRIEDISAATIPADFVRNAKIHNCWRITHDS